MGPCMVFRCAQIASSQRAVRDAIADAVERLGRRDLLDSKKRIGADATRSTDAPRGRGHGENTRRH